MYVIKKVPDWRIGWVYKIMRHRGNELEFVYKNKKREIVDQYYKDLICGKR